MRICVIGAGAMGSLYGGRLAMAGCEVMLVDTWAERVVKINGSGLILDHHGGSDTIPVVAAVGSSGCLQRTSPSFSSMQTRPPLRPSLRPKS